MDWITHFDLNGINHAFDLAISETFLYGAFSKDASYVNPSAPNDHLCKISTMDGSILSCHSWLNIMINDVAISPSETFLIAVGQENNTNVNANWFKFDIGTGLIT